MRTEPLNVGIIGAGDVVHRFFLPELAARSDITISAIVSRDGQRARTTAAQFGIPFSGAGFAELLERPDIEAVIVCTPPAEHLNICRAFLERGKHVLIEKPVCASYNQWQMLRSAADKSEAILYYTFNNRFRHENIFLAKKALDGSNGIIRWIDLEWIRQKPIPKDPWRHDPRASGGGVLADLGAHLLMIALGMVPERSRFILYASDGGQGFIETGIENISNLIVDIESGPMITIRTGWGMAISQNTHADFRVFGDKGTITNTDFQSKRTNGYGPVLTAFVTAVRGQNQPNIGIVDDITKLLDDARRSMLSKEPVRGILEGGSDELFLAHMYAVASDI